MLLLLSARMMDFIAKTNKVIILRDYDTVPGQAKSAVANHANKSSSTRIYANLGLEWFGAK